MRKKTTVSIATLGIVAAFTLGACSSSSSSSKSSSPDAGTSTTATTATSAPAGSSSAPAASGKVQVGVILPDTTSSTRYTLYDKPLLQKAFAAAGIKSDIQNAAGSVPKFQADVQSMVGEGIKVLLMDSIDPTSGAAAEQTAQKAGVKVIDYDRVNLGGSAPYYVSFDNEKVGMQQAQTLVSCLGTKAKPQIIEMDGGTDVDNNAVLFKKGAGEVLAPLQAAGKLKVVSQTTVKGWDVNLAAPAFTQALTANGGKVDGVLAANDDIANAVISVLNSKGLTVPVTGQDSGVEGLQNILKGKQCMTVFKNVQLEAGAAAKLAIALIKGQTPSAAALTLVPFADPKLPSHKISALLLTSQVITKANVEDVVKAGALKASAICNGIAAQCAAAGVK